MTSTPKSEYDEACEKLMDDLYTAATGEFDGFRVIGGALIHSRAKVSPTARVEYGAVIHADVSIGDGAWIGGYSVIGGVPESRDVYHPKTGLPPKTHGVVIRENARIFEFVTVHAGTKQPTLIDARAAVFNHAHIAHDVRVGDSCEIGGHVSLAGHVVVMDGARVSGRATVHPKIVIGSLAMVGLGSVVVSHVGVGEKWIGTLARYCGPNTVGLERAGTTLEEAKARYDEAFDSFVKGNA